MPLSLMVSAVLKPDPRVLEKQQSCAAIRLLTIGGDCVTALVSSPQHLRVKFVSTSVSSNTRSGFQKAFPSPMFNCFSVQRVPTLCYSLPSAINPDTLSPLCIAAVWFLTTWSLCNSSLNVCNAIKCEAMQNTCRQKYFHPLKYL